MDDVQIRAAVLTDCDELGRMRATLWPEDSATEHAREAAELITVGRVGTLPVQTLVAQAADGSLIGFLEVGLRSHADGCNPKRPVGFIEGWFVVESERRKGIGSRLVRAAEDWARGQGCVEMASDTWIDNVTSQRAHQAVGYEVADRCVNFRKAL